MEIITTTLTDIDNAIYFEPVSKYADAGLALPVRKTAGSAGYDLVCAEDRVIYPYQNYYNLLKSRYCEEGCNPSKSLNEIADITKEAHARPALISTGMKCHLPKGYYLELSVRSSSPLKYWLVLANGVGK